MKIFLTTFQILSCYIIHLQPYNKASNYRKVRGSIRHILTLNYNNIDYFNRILRQTNHLLSTQ